MLRNVQLARSDWLEAQPPLTIAQRQLPARRLDVFAAGAAQGGGDAGRGHTGYERPEPLLESRLQIVERFHSRPSSRKRWRESLTEVSLGCAICA